jgi:hypothetical protein
MSNNLKASALIGLSFALALSFSADAQNPGPTQNPSNPTQLNPGTEIAVFFVAAALLFIPTINGGSGSTSFGAPTVIKMNTMAAGPPVQTSNYVANLGFFGPIPGMSLTSFDISWVDSMSQKSDGNQNPVGFNNYYLADRSNASVDVIPIEPNPPVFKVTGGFAGNTGNNNTAGPNGIIVFQNNATTPPEPELWVGDGPTASSACPAGTMCSTVKVFAGVSATLKTTIDTGGVNRADELCYDPDDNLVVIANDADGPPFISFISTAGPTFGTILKKITMDETKLPFGNGRGATNGIGQCGYSHSANKFFINIPEIGGAGDDSSPGGILEINPKTMNIVGVTFILPALCAGPQGLAIGPASPAGGPQLLIGCNAQTTPLGGKPLTGPQNSLIVVTNRAGLPTGFAVLLNQGGSGEVWFEPKSGNYFLADGSSIPTQELGIASSASRSPVQNAFVGFSGTTTRRSHSVAGWSGVVAGVTTSVAFVPISAIGGGTVGFSSTLCLNSVANAVNQGCIAIFGN